MSQERRLFNRVAFNASAIFWADKRQIECEIIDLSLKGALLQLLDKVDVEIDSTYQLDIPLGNSDQLISMELELVHQQGRQLGLVCTHIDLDSITHLRRLVELNLGDSDVLERDFHALIDDNTSA